MSASTRFRLLLDTHIWLWYLLGDARLPARIREAIERDDTELLLSPISLWETHLLIERGRLPVREAAATWIAHALEQLPVTDARITAAIALRSRSIGVSHEDPADRFIVATALEWGAKLATADERLLSSNGVPCY